MASNVGGDNSQDFRNSDNSKSFKVTGGYSSTVKVRRELACKFGDTVTEAQKLEVCIRNRNYMVEKLSENQFTNMSDDTDLDEGNLESVEAKNFKQKLFNEEKEKNAFRKRCQQLEARNDKLASELKDKNKEVSDLREQLADLMRHLDTQQAIANEPDETRQELQDGKVFLAKGPHQPKKTGRRKGRRR